MAAVFLLDRKFLGVCNYLHKYTYIERNTIYYFCLLLFLVLVLSVISF